MNTHELDRPGEGPACCGRKTDLLFVRADVDPTLRSARLGSSAVRVIWQTRCAKCNVADVFSEPTFRTKTAGRLDRAIREGRATFDGVAYEKSFAAPRNRGLPSSGSSSPASAAQKVV